MLRFASILLALTVMTTACGGKGSPVCVEHVDDESAVDIPIGIRNTGDTDVFVLSDCDRRYWRIHRADSTELFPPGDCGAPSCEAPPDEDCRFECPLLCATVPPVRIVPGGVFEVRWPQLVRDYIDREAECDLSCGCVKTSRAVAGDSLVLDLTVTRDVAGCMPNECDCSPDAQGSCEVSEGTPGPGVEVALPIVFTGTAIEVELGPL